MKIFALVELAGIRHMVDDRELAHEIREEAAARGARLILMRPQEDIIEEDRLAAITTAIRAGGSGNDFGDMIMAALDDLKAAVAKNTTVVESTLTLLGGIAERLNAANVNNDPTIAALASEIDSEASKLAGAVAANTPAVSPVVAEVIPPADVPAEPTPETPPS